MLPVLADEQMPAASHAVIDDIRATRKTDFVNNLWRVLANDPALLKRTWEGVKEVMGPGTIDPLVKEMIYIAVSMTNNCEYCIRSHTAAARAKGLSDPQFTELMSIVALANNTNRLAIGLQVPVDEVFKK
jgi:AhpD family alkylhydroperoxidase